MRDRAKSAGRALDVLSAISTRPGGVTFAELLTELGLPKSSLHEVIAVLVGRRFIELDPESRRLSLSVRTWELGARYFSQHDLATEARPIMQSVVSAINETVQLAVLDGLDNVYLAKVDCSHPVRMQSDVGKRLAAHATGLGKVLLAALDPTVLRPLLEAQPLARFTTNTIVDVPILVAHLETVATSRVAIDDQEISPGLRCVAVPVFDHRGQVAAALSVSVPMMRAQMSPLPEALALIAEASIRISERIGASSEDPILRTLTRRSEAKAAIALALPHGSNAASRLANVRPVEMGAQ